MTNPIISVDALSKSYRIGNAEKRVDTFAGFLWDMLKTPGRNFRSITNLAKSYGDESTLFWALKNISFEVDAGEVLGIIGHNGAGKSTLLKILSRITDPTSGRVRLKGRVSSLLEVGTGFHPELTGRENIFMNGTLLGMRKREIDCKLEEIIAFSGISRHIDTPVKRYSSGMTVRLAFAVAAHLEPEILIVDEVLAVGDAEFQRKCIAKMESVSRQEGRTVLVVSHSLTTVKSLCSRALLLSKGEVVANGNTIDVVDQYTKTYKPDSVYHDFGEFKVINVNVKPNLVYSGRQLVIEARLWLAKESFLQSFFWVISSDLGEKIGSIQLRDVISEVNAKKDVIVDVVLPDVNLRDGSYNLGFYYKTGNSFEFVDNVFKFSVVELERSENSDGLATPRGFLSFTGSVAVRTTADGDLS